MNGRRYLAVPLVAAFLAAACAGESPRDTAGDATTRSETSTDTQEREERENAGSATPQAREGKNDRGRERGGSSVAGKGASKTQRDPTRETAGEDDASSTFYPAAGTYTYDQKGSEQFCDASSCEEQDLPPTQVVRTTHGSSRGGEVVVITNAKASNSRSVRTQTTHSREGAFITNVRIHFEYQGFTFNNSYQPSPPVEAVRLPLRKGAAWQGRWQDSTSGDYNVDVGAVSSVSVAGGTVQAFPLHTVTNFRGEFEGRADVTVWIDPATSAIVRTQGEIRVKSVFGSYFTRFDSTLRSAPGYR